VPTRKACAFIEAATRVSLGLLKPVNRKLPKVTEDRSGLNLRVSLLAACSFSPSAAFCASVARGDVRMPRAWGPRSRPPARVGAPEESKSLLRGERPWYFSHQPRSGSPKRALRGVVGRERMAASYAGGSRKFLLPRSVKAIVSTCRDYRFVALTAGMPNRRDQERTAAA
jgi:hypothetical protein